MLEGSGISVAELGRADIRITTHQEMQVCANAVEEIGINAVNVLEGFESV